MTIVLDDSFALLDRHRRLLARRGEPDEVPFVVGQVLAAWNADPQLSPRVGDLLREAGSAAADCVEAVTPLLGLLNRVWEEAGTHAPNDATWEEASRVMTRTQGGPQFASVPLLRNYGPSVGSVAEQHKALAALVRSWRLAERDSPVPGPLAGLLEEVGQKLSDATRVLAVHARRPPLAMARLTKAADLLPDAHTRRPLFATDPPSRETGQDGSLRVRTFGAEEDLQELAASEDSSLRTSGSLKILSRSLADDLEDVIDELEARLGSVRSRLAVVDRFAWRSERYDRARLVDVAERAPRRQEAALRDEFARYLFDQGLMPLTEVPGSTTRSDILDVQTGPPLIVEAKQYNGGGAKHLERLVVEAYWQIVDTVAELTALANFSEAFVVIFRRGGSQILLPPDPVRLGGMDFYFRSVDLADSKATGSGAASSPVDLTADKVQKVVADAPRPDPSADDA